MKRSRYATRGVGAARRAVVIALGVALVATLVPAEAVWALASMTQAPAVAPPPEPSPDDDTVAEEDADDTRSEIKRLRTRSSKTYRVDGAVGLTTEISTGPVHFRDGQDWRDIDTRLIAAGNGLVSDAANASDVTITLNAARRGLATYTPKPGLAVTFGMQGAASVEGQVRGSSIAYEEVFPDTQVRLTALPNGVKEDLVLHSPNGPHLFVFPLHTEGLTPSQSSDGSIVFTDSSGQPRAIMPPGWMVDSSGGFGEGVISGGVTYELVSDGNDHRVVVTLDKAWLRDSAREYPVIVDPTVTSYGYHHSSDTFVTDSAPDTNFSTSTALRVGMSDAGAGTDNRHNTFISFDLRGLRDDPRQILKAELRLNNNFSATCADRAVDVRRVTSSMSPGTVTWNTRPTTTAVYVTKSTKSYGNETLGCNNAYLTYNVRTPVAQWTRDPYDSLADEPNYGFELRADVATDPTYYKNFPSREASCCQPLLTVTHNKPPKRSYLYTWTAQYINEAEVYTWYEDPDSDTGIVNFEAKNLTTGLVTKETISKVPSGQDHTWWRPAIIDGMYSFSGSTSDGYLSMPIAGISSICLDRASPTSPPGAGSASHDVAGASTDATIDAYWSDATDDDTCKAWDGTGWNRTLDDVHYSYAFNQSASEPADTRVTSDEWGWARTVSSPPLAAGEWWFHVRAVDNAGNASDDVAVGPFLIDQRPDVPILLSPDNGAVLGSRKPVLTARYNDPDAEDDGYLRFQIRDAAGNVQDAMPDEPSDESTHGVQPWHDANIGADPHDATIAWRTPLPDGNYEWRAAAHDGHFESQAPSPWRTFTVDADVAPVISKVVTRDDGSAAKTVSQGESVTYRLVVKNPQTVPMTVESVVDDLPQGLSVSAGGVDFAGTACAAAPTEGRPSCAITGQKVQLGAFTLSAGDSVTVDVHAVAAVTDGGKECRTVQNYATATSSGGEAASNIVPLTICDIGLGLEHWWTTVSEQVGPQETASVNAGNGNLVVQATDSTPVQGHGRMSYVLRRTYNSSDTTALTLPGTIGAGWQLNVGQSGDLIGDGVGATGLYVPPAQSFLRPLAVTLVDRDGTRHAFTPKATSLGFDVGSLDVADPKAALKPQTITPPDGQVLCLDTTYEAPPGVELSLWRYVQVAATDGGCAAAPAEGTVVGFAAMRPDRLRYEFGADGRLLTMTDGAGVGLRYVYEDITNPLSQSIGPRLTAVYEPSGCSPVSQTSAGVAAAGCRMLTLEYKFDAIDDLARVNRIIATDPAGRRTVYRLDHPELGAPQRLIGVDSLSKDDPTVSDADEVHTSVSYTYGDCGGPDNQLCSVTDAKGSLTRFSYEAPTTLGAPGRLTRLMDRRVAALPTNDQEQRDKQERESRTFTYGASEAPVTTVTRDGREHVFGAIDAAARVGSVQIRSTMGVVASHADILWDKPGASCARSGGVNNNLCVMTQRSLRADAPDQETRWQYNGEGAVLIKRHLNSTGDTTTTFGYRTQFVDQSGATHTSDDIAGSGNVTDGSRADAADALYVLSDRTQSLIPRGNAAGDAFAPFLTTFEVDASNDVAPNTSGVAGACTTSTKSNTGLVCGQEEPRLAGTARRTTRHTYDNFGQRSTTLSPKAVAEGGGPTTYHYYSDADTDLSGTTSSGGWLRAVADPNGNFVAFGYDAAGNVVRTWDRNATAGRAVDSYPEAVGLPSSTPYSQAEYADPRFRSGTAEDAFAHPWRFKTREKDPVGNVSTLQLDANGNPASLRPPRGSSAGSAEYDTTFEYDLLDRRTATIRPSGRAAGGTRITYDTFGNPVSTTDPLGRVKVTIYDAADRVIGTRWTRTAAGTGQAPPGCQEIADAADAPIPAGRYICETEQVHDGAGNVIATTDAEGHTTTSTFDALGREISRRVPRSTTETGEVTYVKSQVIYDADGNITDVCAPREFTEGTNACTDTAAYSQRAYSTHVEYDPAGGRSAVIRFRKAEGPDLVTLREAVTFDADGNAVTVENARGKITKYEYNILGRKLRESVPRETLADGSVTYNETTWRYDNVGNTTAIIAPDPTRTDPQDTHNNRVSAFSYDHKNRLVDAVTAADHVDARQAGVATGGANRRTRREYDANGNVIAVWSPRAFTQSTAEYDDGDATTADPDADFVIRTLYDADDRPFVQLVPRANTNNRGPHDEQQEQCVTGLQDYDSDTLVCRTSAEYDAVGNRTRLWLPTSTYDPVAKTGGDNRYIAWTYTDDNLVGSVDAPSPHVNGDRVEAAKHFYDGVGRPLRIQRPLPSVTNPDGSTELQFAQDAYTWTFDGLLRRLERQDSNAGPVEPDRADVTHVTAYGYDADGNPISETSTVDGTPRTTSRTYTSDGLLGQLTEPGGRTTTYEYNRAGQPAAVYSPNANVRRHDDDPATAGLPTSYTYTDDGLVDTVTAPVAVAGGIFRRTTYEYDDAGRKTSQKVEKLNGANPPAVLADGGTQRFKYWPTDDLRTEVARGGETIDNTYDAAGNLAKVTQTVGGAESTLTASYYFDDLVRDVQDGAATSSYTYDAAGQAVVRKHGDNLTRYRYNDAGLATEATSDRTGNTRKWTWTYDIRGRAATEQQPDGRRADWDWNDDNTLREYTVTDTDESVVSKWQYTYDELNRITVADVPEAKGATVEIADTSTRRYRYDAGGRVDCYTIDTPIPTDCAAATSDDVKAGKWDANNNRLAWGKQRFTYNADDTINTATDNTGANPQTLTYHAFGGLDTDGCGDYTYDGFDRLESLAPLANPTGTDCSANAATVSYTYDGLDRQRTKTLTPPAPITLGPKTTHFSYDGLTSQTIKEVDSGEAAKPSRDFTLGADGTPKAVTAQDAVGLEVTEFLQTDGHGNIVATLKDGAGVSCTVRYDPFGSPEKVGAGDQDDGVCNTGGDTSNDLFYRGARRDNTTGNYQLGSRTYDPSKAGFLTPDSYRTQQPTADLSIGVDPLTRNRYSYVNGDPVNLIDPDGHEPCPKSGCTYEEHSHKRIRQRAAQHAAAEHQSQRAESESQRDAAWASRGAAPTSGGGGPLPVEQPSGDEFDPGADYEYCLKPCGIVGAVLATVRVVEYGAEACGFIFDPCDVGAGAIAGIRGDGAGVAAGAASAVPFAGAGTRAADWAATASKAADGVTEATEQAAKAFDDLAEMRRSLNLPPAGSLEDKATLARLDIGDDKFYGINAHGQEYGPLGPGMGISAKSKWHAEADVFGQAARAGDSRGGSAILYVDRKPCPWCRNSMAGQARKLGLDQLVVIGPRGVDGAYISSVDRYVRAEWAPR